MKSELTQLEFLARGKRGVVHQAQWEGKKVAVKTQNQKSAAQNRILNEANFLKVLNGYGIGPKLLYSDEECLILEFIEGERILEYFQNHTKKEILFIIQKIMKQTKKLDALGINKLELTNPYKDLLVRDGEPVLLDFERCKKTIRPKNARQFEQFLQSKKVQVLLQEKGIDSISLIK